MVAIHLAAAALMKPHPSVMTLSDSTLPPWGKSSASVEILSKVSQIRGIIQLTKVIHRENMVFIEEQAAAPEWSWKELEQTE